MFLGGSPRAIEPDGVAKISMNLLSSEELSAFVLMDEKCNHARKQLEELEQQWEKEKQRILTSLLARAEIDKGRDRS